MRPAEFFDKANVLPIVRAHFDTMSSYKTGQPLKSDYVLFFGIPILAGVILDSLRFGYRLDAVAGFLNAFAILTGLLLNLLVLVFTISMTTGDRPDLQIRRRVLKQVFANVCFCIIIAIGATVTALVALSYMHSVPYAQTGLVATFLLTFLTANFVLSLLMVLKRMYKVISAEFDSTSKKAA